VTASSPIGRGVLAGRDALGLADLVEDAAAGRDVGSAGFRQRQLARGPVQQARMQVRFQLGHLAADGRQRRTETARRRRQAAGVDDGQQYGHGFETIH
jgi:hypothetical protein